MSDVDEYLAGYLGYVDRIAGLIPYERAKIWREFFLNPTAVIKKDDVGIGQRLMDNYAMVAVDFVLVAIMYLPMLLFMTIFSGGVGLLTVGIFLAVFIALFLLSPLITFVYSLLELLVAKLLGGAGDMRSNFNASSLPNLSVFIVGLPLTVLMIPLVWLGFVPIVSLCASCIQMPISIVSMVLGLYGYYLKYVAFKEVHKLTPLKAAAVVILPVLLILVIAVLLVVLMYAAMFAWLMSVMAVAKAGGGA